VNFRRSRRRSAPGIDLVNLIDVIFMLLIFFMMSTTFTHEARLRIDLPEADGEPRTREGDAIRIAIDRRGDYSVENRLLVNTELATLMRALEQAIAGRNVATQQVIITADANATHQSVVRAMDAAGKLGLSRVSIATTHSDGEG
jgi:biopolymer transport protein ExbD